MGNRQRGEVSFEADNKNWTMKIDTNAMCMIEDLTGKGIAEIGQILSNPKTSTITLVRTVFQSSLSKKHELTTEEVGELMDELGIKKVGDLIGQAFKLAFPEQKKKEGAEGAPQDPLSGAAESQTSE